MNETCFLLVEDHEFQRRALRRMLTELGARKVVDVGGGREALDVFSDLTQPLDIVVTDINMPDGDGMELLRHIGESGAPTSVILVSALDPSLVATVQRMATAYGVRVLGALEKPVRCEALRELVARHVRDEPQSPRFNAQAPSFSGEQLAAAIDAGQFHPWYQPIVSLPAGRVLAAEALVRWRHPVRGWLSPGLFVDAIERCGLIDALTWRMLDQASRDCREWRRHGLGARVSVNLSALSLAQPTTAERVARIVAGTGLDPRNVLLELTESAATAQVAHTLENAARLRMLGFEIAVDDYGTGYSSMQQLARIPFTKLKIDRSFVHGAAHDRRLQVLVLNSIRMAKELGMACVAEGVETSEDWDMLAAADCDAAQGFHIARPMTAAAFVEWSRSWSTPDAGPDRQAVGL